MDQEAHLKMIVEFQKACHEWAEETENGYHVDMKVFTKGFESGLKTAYEIRDSNVATVFGLKPMQIETLKNYYLKHNKELPE